MTSTTEDDFKSGLIGLIPQMRAFARSLSSNRAEAEDLAQTALAKAWAARSSFAPGTNMKAWTFMIVRNEFYSEKRRSWRTSSLDPEVAERTLTIDTNPTAAFELDELRRAMAMLPDEQREALILIGAGGLSYEEVGSILDVNVGTIKSRVSRARARLAQIYTEGSFPNDNALPSAAMASIFAQMEQSRQRSA